MRVTPRHILVPILPTVVGVLLMILGLWGGWGLVWAAAGAFFVTIGIAAEVVALAWVAPGRLGDLLRRPVVTVLIVVAVVAMMILTVWLGVLNQLR